MSDRMFLPFEVDSHGRIASVQRRVKGFSSIHEVREHGRMSEKTCCVLIELEDLIHGPSRLWMVSVHGGSLV